MHKNISIWGLPGQRTYVDSCHIASPSISESLLALMYGLVSFLDFCGGVSQLNSVERTPGNKENVVFTKSLPSNMFGHLLSIWKTYNKFADQFCYAINHMSTIGAMFDIKQIYHKRCWNSDNDTTCSTRLHTSMPLCSWSCSDWSHRPIYSAPLWREL